MKALKIIIPYLLTSLLVIGFWKIWTLTDNYAFNPKGKEILSLDIALTFIFIYKTAFWLVITNLLVFTTQQLIKKKYITIGISALATISFYFIVGQYVKKECAFYYYTVFQNQSTMEEQITRPIIEAGYSIGPILTRNIADKNMKNRNYAIGGLREINYIPSTNTLKNILFDKTENATTRADAYFALSTFNTNETKNIILDFRNNATDTLDKKVIDLAKYFITND